METFKLKPLDFQAETFRYRISAAVVVPISTPSKLASEQEKPTFLEWSLGGTRSTPLCNFSVVDLKC